MAISSFSGLASGVQWRDLIDQIMETQKAPINRLTTEKKALDAKKTAWGSFRTLVSALQKSAAGLSAGTSLRSTSVTTENRTSGAAPLSVTPSTTATPGTYRVDVVSLAAAEKLGGKAFSSTTDARGLAGTFIVGGRALTVAASDSLTDIAKRFNDLNSGASPSGVTASVLATGTGSYRLVLSADDPGAAGMDLRDASGTVLRDLGLLDAATTLRTPIAGGARSAAFDSSDGVVGTLLGLGASPAATVRIGTADIAIDLAQDSLASIAGKINGAGVVGLSAQVVADATDPDAYRLEVTGTSHFADSGRVLETLGLLSATRTSAAQQIQSGAYTAGGTTAVGGSALVDLRHAVGGASTGVTDGDRLTLAGTRADGTAFTIALDVTAGTTLDDVVARLNSADGFGADPANSLRPTATAAVVAGRIVVTDATAGDSALSLAMTAVDPLNGTVRDLGNVSLQTEGRTRLLARASDAVLRVDGTYVTRTTNEVSDVIDGVTLNLSGTGTVDLTVARDLTAATTSINGFVKAYNDLATFVAQQLAPPATGAKPAPLYSDATLRTMQFTLRDTLRSTLASGVAGTLTRLADLGIEIDRNGQFTVDQAKLTDGVKTHFADVQRLFGNTGTSSNSLLSYVSASAATKPGLYAVNITQAATAATATGSDFDLAYPGGYAGDPSDTVKVKDLASGSTYEVALAGRTSSDVAAALTSAFATATSRQLQGATTLNGASGSTLLTGVSLGGGSILAGDEFTFAGTRSDGTAFTDSFTAGAGSTVSQLIAAVQSAVGSDATVSLTDDRIQVVSDRTGSSSLSLTIVQERTGAHYFGAFGVAREGRPSAALTASAAGGRLTLSHATYGSAAGFAVSYGGAVVGDPLGFGLVEHRGVDVAGTIGGEVATGSGKTLTGRVGTDTEGLILSYAGAPDATLSMRFSRGIGALAEAATKVLTEAESGAIDSLTARLEERMQYLEDRADTLEQRLETRREQLIRQFTAMEQAMSKSQSQSAWLTSQMAQFEKKS